MELGPSGIEDLAEIVEKGDLDDKLDDKAAIKVVDDVLAKTILNFHFDYLHPSLR